jgi:hypothetical protein
MGELGATVLVYPRGCVTLPVAIAASPIRATSSPAPVALHLKALLNLRAPLGLAFRRDDPIDRPWKE